jgi:organic hydroperoxide reductase OsmC/OhrA
MRGLDMAKGLHHYRVTVAWTGNTGKGTTGYTGYRRDHDVQAEGKASIAGSSDPSFRGDPTRWNPEELLLASASACHQLWYLHLCADAGVRVEAYVDHAEGTMTEEAPGRFTDIVLRPRVTLAAGGDAAKAQALHHQAHEACFVANSLKVAVRCEAVVEVLPNLA